MPIMRHIYENSSSSVNLSVFWRHVGKQAEFEFYLLLSAPNVDAKRTKVV